MNEFTDGNEDSHAHTNERVNLISREVSTPANAVLWGKCCSLVPHSVNEYHRLVLFLALGPGKFVGAAANSRTCYGKNSES